MNLLVRTLHGGYLQVVWSLFNHSPLAVAYQMGATSGVDAKVIELRSAVIRLEVKIDALIAELRGQRDVERAKDLVTAFDLGYHHGQRVVRYLGPHHQN